MIEIIIDHNNDMIVLGSDPVTKNISFKLKGCNFSTVGDMIVEMVNLIDAKGVTVKEINEDTIRILGEW